MPRDAEAAPGVRVAAAPGVEIYLLRHGQTAFNVARRYQGALDSPLTAKGEAQALAMGRRLAALLPDHSGWRMAASPLGRAAESARLIRQALPPELPFAVEPRLAEIAMGEWDGLTFEELEARRPRGVPHDERCFHGPGGEDYAAFSGRLADWLGSLEPGQRVIAVAHGVVGRVLCGLYLGLPRERMMRQDAPQDAFFRLADGEVRRVDC